MSLNKILSSLYVVEGYLASAIFDVYGEVIITDNKSKYKIELIGERTSEIVSSAISMLKHSGLGKCKFVQVNSEHGKLVSVWAVEDRSILTVLLKPNSNVGLVKLLLKKVSTDFL